MSAKLTVQHGPLIRHQEVTVTAAPLVEMAHRPGETVPHRLAFDRPVFLPGAPPIVREAEHIEAAFPLRLLRPPVGRAEVHQTRFLRV